MRNHFAEARTPGGHLAPEVASALQKALRRGDERGALYWMSELDLAGYTAYVWRRLRVVASEDVGLADPLAVLTVHTLYDAWREFEKAAKARGETRPGRGGARLFLVHAVLLLARAPKSRLVDHATIATYRGERPTMKIPDHALDRHTRRGRQLGRGVDHFFDESAQLVNEAAIDDPYRDEARAAFSRETVAPEQLDLEGQS